MLASLLSSKAISRGIYDFLHQHLDHARQIYSAWALVSPQEMSRLSSNGLTYKVPSKAFAGLRSEGGRML